MDSVAVDTTGDGRHDTIMPNPAAQAHAATVVQNAWRAHLGNPTCHGMPPPAPPQESSFARAKREHNEKKAADKALTDKLKRLQSMLDQGVLTQEEYEAKRAQVVDSI